MFDLSNDEFKPSYQHFILVLVRAKGDESVHIFLFILTILDEKVRSLYQLNTYNL